MIDDNKMNLNVMSSEDVITMLYNYAIQCTFIVTTINMYMLGPHTNIYIYIYIQLCTYFPIFLSI